MRKVRKKIEDVEVNDIGTNGKGIARVDNQVIFISGTVPGDVADIEVYRKKRNYLEANPVMIKKPSPKRKDPVCEHFGICGGCTIQNMEYNSQLQVKQKIVTDNLIRLANLKDIEVNPIIGSLETEFYRNKLEFTFSNSRWLTGSEIEGGEEITNKNALGFHIPGRYDKILDISKCYLQGDPSNMIRNHIREYAVKNELSFFDHREKSGFLRNLIIRTTTTGETLLLVVFGYDNKIERESLLNFALNEIPEITSLYYIINTKPNDSVQDLQPVHFSGKELISENIEHITIQLGSKSFYQTNSKQAKSLYKEVRKIAGAITDKKIYDLYSGVGSIGLYLAKDSKKIIGIENIDEAVKLAELNRKSNNISNAEFHLGLVENIFTNSFAEQHGFPDLVILDPPRPGLHKNVIKTLLDIIPAEILYVSCNPSTQARDIQLLSEKYDIVDIQPIDMFPHTLHIENIVKLVCKNE